MSPSKKLEEIERAFAVLLKDYADARTEWSHEVQEDTESIAYDAQRALALVRELREQAVEGWAEKDEWWSERGLPQWVLHEGDGLTEEGKRKAKPAILIIDRTP